MSTNLIADVHIAAKNMTSIIQRIWYIKRCVVYGNNRESNVPLPQVKINGNVYIVAVDDKTPEPP